jgi:hypothetical protein
MITREKADRLEKLVGQLVGIHDELSALAKKAPNDAVNAFKLRFVNAVLLQCNEILGSDYRPIGEFKEFNLDDVPSNSDVTFVVSQYLQALEKLRSDHISIGSGGWYYDLPKGDPSKMRAAVPAKLKK